MDWTSPAGREARQKVSRNGEEWVKVGRYSWDQNRGRGEVTVTHYDFLAIICVFGVFLSYVKLAFFDDEMNAVDMNSTSIL